MSTSGYRHSVSTMRTGRLMGAGEIGRRLGVGPSRVQQIINRKGFPDPYDELDMGKVWRTADVEKWIRDHRRDLAENPEGSE
jgi:prophage regulatory protein